MERLTIRSWAFIGIGSAAMAAISKAFMMSISSSDERIQSALRTIRSNELLRQALGPSGNIQTKWPRVLHYPDSNGNDCIHFKMTCDNGAASVSIINSKLSVECPWKNQRYILGPEGTVTEPFLGSVESNGSSTFRYIGNIAVLGTVGLGLFSAWRFNQSGGFTGIRLIKMARTNPDVLQVLGDNLQMNGRMTGRISEEVVNVRIPLKGSKSHGTVVLQAIRPQHGSEKSNWKYTYAAVEGDRIQRIPINV